MTYDEFDIEAKLIYRGNPLQLPAAPPSADQIMTGDGHLLLAGFLLKREADRVQSGSKGDDCILQMHFRQ
jgi:hypothetical protein